MVDHTQVASGPQCQNARPLNFSLIHPLPDFNSCLTNNEIKYSQIRFISKHDGVVPYMEESELLKKRREKVDSLKEEGIDLYPNDIRVGGTTRQSANGLVRLTTKRWKR